MTVTLERTYTSATRGDEALAIIDAYRRIVEDNTRVETLDAEFPYYVHDLGLSGVKLADLGDNTSGAFKWRGAFLGASRLKEQGADQLIAPSAGNHARGAVLAAKALDMYVTVAVPSSAPPAKRERIRDLWDSHKLRVVTAGATFDESLAWALEQPGALLHPYDNADVIAGQGTVVDDILNQAPDAKHFVVPVGGGGLAAGVLGRLDELGRNDITVHIAEAAGSNSLSKSLRNYEVTAADAPNKRYGGSAVQKIGALGFDAFIRYANVSVISVPEHDVNELSELYIDGRRELLRETTPNFEPTSLVAVAAVKQLGHLNQEVVVLGTGHNDHIFPVDEQRSYHVPM
jgi:threonine dehydratase